MWCRYMPTDAEVESKDYTLMCSQWCCNEAYKRKEGSLWTIVLTVKALGHNQGLQSFHVVISYRASSAGRYWKCDWTSNDIEVWKKWNVPVHHVCDSYTQIHVYLISAEKVFVQAKQLAFVKAICGIQSKGRLHLYIAHKCTYMYTSCTKILEIVICTCIHE